MSKKNMRRISILVTAQTAKNLERLASMCGYREIGMVVDKLTREKMISLHTDALMPGGKKGETDMGYRCNCPEYEERPCDNLNEELECEECQHGKPEESEEQK